MAIIINEQVFKKLSVAVHPDKTKKLTEVEKKIAGEIFLGINEARDKATQKADANGEKYMGKYKYPFEYEPKKDEYCFLLPKVYKYNGGNNGKLENLLTTNCEDFTKSNFNIEQQMLINERLYSFPDNGKREKIQESYITLNDGKEHTNSEINDALLCIQGILDEC